ncbi:hypothetical protein CWR43_14435 [Rhizobium sullae]|uniref:Uncharacterized protein n=1 Tax=Rhizobium sullae TaxID=50338 RepID=A0A2N0DAX8_RHISU|nr:hypothetical protein [Rhizobium sullae]PKA43237.1 hypothetical protein CWR43_14435 [Rhizobium sullae]
MARRRSRKSESNTGLIIGTVLFGLASIAIVGAFVVLQVQANSKPVLDKVTLCPESGPKAITAVLLDVTDPISDVTSLDLRNQFQDIVKSVPEGGLIQVYTLTDSQGTLGQTFSGCNPGNGDSVDDLTGNKRLAKERWEKGFQRPLDEIANKIDKGTSGKQSPIMAGIQKINLNVFGAPQYRDIPKELIVASDMVEHTSAFSMYTDGADFQKFQKSAGRDQFRTALNGAPVRILEFQRPGLKFDSMKLAEFWTAWIVANDGQLERFTRLEGIR